MEMPTELAWETPLLDAYGHLVPLRNERGGLPLTEILAAHELHPEYERDFFIAAMRRMNAAYTRAAADG